MAYLTAAALDALEKTRPEGLTRNEVLALFADAGDKFSASLISSYVAWGLVPVSKRADDGFNKFSVKAIRVLNRVRRKVIEKVTYRDLRDQQFGIEVFALEAVQDCLAELRRLAMRIEQKATYVAEHRAVWERMERIKADTAYIIGVGERVADQ